MEKNIPNADAISDLLNKIPKLEDAEKMKQEYEDTVEASTEPSRYKEEGEYAQKNPRKYVVFSNENLAFLESVASEFGVHRSNMVNSILDKIREEYGSVKEFVDADIYGLREKNKKTLLKNKKS